MFKKLLKKANFYLLGILFCLVFTGLYYTLISQQKPPGHKMKEPDYLALTEFFVKKVKKIWELGDLEGAYAKNALNCPKFVEYNPHVTKRYLECNPKYIECLFSKKPLSNKGFNFTLKKVHSYSPVRMTFELESQAQNQKRSFKQKVYINLKNTCHRVELKGGAKDDVYTLASLGKKMWTPRGRKLVLDKFLVTQGEINLWKPGFQNNPKEWGMPALGLSELEQKAYCKSRNAQVMKAHIFEAATRLKPSSKLSRYPWTHYSANSKQGLVKAKLDKALCAKAYLKECKGLYPWISYLGDSVSWSGLHNVFGGPAERFVNIYEAEKSLKKADWFVSMKDLKLAQIGFKKQEQIPNDQIGFRCYQEVLK